MHLEPHQRAQGENGHETYHAKRGNEQIRRIVSTIGYYSIS